MSKFKIGDRVKITPMHINIGAPIDNILTISDISTFNYNNAQSLCKISKGDTAYQVLGENCFMYWAHDKELERHKGFYTYKELLSKL